MTSARSSDALFPTTSQDRSLGTAPDLVILGGTVHTMAPDDRIDGAPAAIGITDGVISHLGTIEESAQWGTAPSIDHRGHVVTPGLVDAHMHPIHGQGSARGIFLGTARSPADVVRILRDEMGTEDWVLGWGLQQTAFGIQGPTHGFLDDAFPGRRVALMFFDGHALLASSAALHAAGITQPSQLHGGGQVVGDTEGVPTGLLLEHSAMELVRRVIPALSFDEKVARVRATLEGMASAGLTGGEMLDLEDPQSIEILEAIEADGDLPIRLRVVPWVLPRHGEEQLKRALHLQGHRGRRWEVRGIKLMIDGTIDNGTAWLAAPDTAADGLQSLYADPSDYTALLHTLHGRGIGTTTHAIGDRGIRFVIDAIASLPEGGPRHRIEHLEEVRDEDLRALSTSGAAASMQPTHCTHFLAADGSDAWSRRLGDERVDFAFRTHDVREAVGHLALGSDWPIAPYDPREIMADARSRRHTKSAGSAHSLPAQALSARHALLGFTRDVYESSGRQGGMISVGMAADFTVFDADPLAIAPEALLELPVTATYVAGQRVRPGPLPATSAG